MLRFLLCQALRKPFDLDSPWLALADGFADACLLCTITLMLV